MFANDQDFPNKNFVQSEIVLNNITKTEGVLIAAKAAAKQKQI